MTTLEKIEKLTELVFVNEWSIDWRTVSEMPLTEEFIREFQDKVYWLFICVYQELSEDFIREFRYKVNWYYISEYQKLSENFIREFQDNVDWNEISFNQKLSEDFIREFQDKVDWYYISWQQKLSEDFIREFQDKVNWDGISESQRLSEDFIHEFHDKVDWNYISKYQKLSEDFIREFQDKVDWYGISVHQRLSEDFIREFQDKVVWTYISKYQRLSKDFISEFGDYYLYKDLIIDNWIYKPIEEKKQAIIETGKYECHEDYFIAYKAIENDRYSKFNFQYQYLPGEEYESWCDCSNDENSFGLSVGTMKFCENYATKKDIIVKAQIRYEDVGRVVYDGEKIRCFKIKIID